MITWADLRSNSYALKLKNTPAGNNIYERTGTPIHPMSPLCKLMWMKDALPDIFSTSHKFISIKEYIFYHLFGEFIIDHSIASATGLFDIRNMDWNMDALNQAGINADRLSRVVSTSHIIKGLKEPYASSLGIDTQTPFVIGANDGCLAHLGSNAILKGDVSLTIGTSGAVRMMMHKPVHDQKQRIFNYLLTDDLYVAGGPVNNGGNVLQWYATNFLKRPFNTPEDFQWFIDETGTISPGSEGLIFLPYIYGERAPVWDASARGVFYGISGTHTSAHFMRAIMEGVAFALYGIMQSLEETIAPVNNIYVSGGFIRSSEWVQLMSDVFGRKLSVTHGSDASAAGAAIIALRALGRIKNIEDAQSFFSVKESFEPDMEKHEVYMKNYKVYAGLYDKLKD
jgi:gluconokinase